MRFFAEHGRCARGFDLRHPGGPGSGNLLARCRGCGAEVSYASDNEEVLETAPAPEAKAGTGTGASAGRPAGVVPPLSPQPPASVVPSPTPRRPAGVVPPPGPQRPVAAPKPTTATTGAPPPRRSGWRSPITTTAISCLAVASAAFAGVRLGAEDATSTPSGSLGAQSALTATAGSPSSDNAPTDSSNGAPSKRRNLAEDGPSISVPGGWEIRRAGEAIVLSPRGSSHTEVRVYFQRGASIGGDTLLSQTRDLLAREHPGAKLTTAAPLISGSHGPSFVATYDEGFERAEYLIDNGMTILVLARADNAAKPEWQSQMLEIAASVRG